MKLAKQELDAERWKLIEGTKNSYVSDMGRVKTIYKSGPRYHSIFKKKNYYCVKVNYKEYKIAQLVWRTFVGKYDGSKYSLVHKVLKSDNRLCNLKLMTKEEAGKQTGHRSRRIGIYQIDREKKEVYAYYKSTREAAAKTFINRQTISDICNHKIKNNYYGVDFAWATEIEDAEEGYLNFEKIK